VRTTSFHPTEMQISFVAVLGEEPTHIYGAVFIGQSPVFDCVGHEFVYKHREGLSIDRIKDDLNAPHFHPIYKSLELFAANLLQVCTLQLDDISSLLARASACSRPSKAALERDIRARPRPAFSRLSLKRAQY